MNNILKKISIVLLTFICVFTLGTMEVSAASASTSISGGSAEVGEEVIVTVTINSKQTLGTYNLYVEYDADKLKFSDSNSGDFTGGGGQVKIVGGADTTEEKSVTYNITFIANKAGKAKLSVSGSAYYFDEDKAEVVDMEVKSSSSTLKVTAPVVASDDNTLSELTLQTDSASGVSKEVELTPEFSPDVTEYHTTLTYDVNKVIVSATQADPNATVAISGTRIDPGENTTKIVVTAEDGSVKEYIIYSTKTNDLPEPNTEESTEETTTRPEEATENIYVESMEKYIIVDISNVEIPEGFEESTYTYDGKTVNVARGISKKLVLMYMADDEELTNAAFYIYDDKNESFYKLANINTDKKTYTIIKTPKDLEIPEGFEKKKVKIDGTNVDSWRIEGNEEFYLLYAMNWEGSTGLYVYDRKEATMQRYIDGLIDATAVGDVEAGVTEEVPSQNSEELENLYKTVDKIKKEYNNDRELKWKIIIGISVVCILLIILCIVLLLKLKDVEIIEEEEEDPDEVKPEQQLKLDMAAQANAMSSGALAANVEEIVNQEENIQEENIQEENIQEESTQEENVQEETLLEENEKDNSKEDSTKEKVVQAFVEPKEPVFVQPEEIKPVVFEEKRQDEVKQKTTVDEPKVVKEEMKESKPGVEEKVAESEKKSDEEFTVSGGFGFDEQPEKKKKNRGKKKREKQVVEDFIDDDDDDFEIEFVEIEDDDID